MMSDKDVILRLTLSVLLSGMIGFERQIRHRGAGLRTHILVCLGSTLIMLTSMYVFDIYKDRATLDPARIAAGVITGVGFLCAGTIIRYGEAIRGLTTATSLWLVSAVGLAIGIGFYNAAFVTTILALIILMLLRRFEDKVLSKQA
mgnify:CR=1 FL=1